MRQYYNGVPIAGSGDGGLPSGAVIAWHGRKADVPDGWAVCNGENGTPDLRGRFLIAASEEYPVESTGGEKAVTLTVEQMPKHNHMLRMLSKWTVAGATALARSSGAGNDVSVYSSEMENAGGSQAHNNMPPYYAILYIMKL